MGNSICVVYLCWMPYGLKCFEDFIVSYKKFRPGLEHDLLIIFKNENASVEIEPFSRLLAQYHIKYKHLIYTGNELDIATYYWAARQLTCHHILFLNTRSRALIDNWLNMFWSASKSNPSFVIAATGTWQSYVVSVLRNTIFSFKHKSTLTETAAKLKLLLKATTLWLYYFPMFPNPHIRTNAFFINRQLFLSMNIGIIKTKINAYRFESGRNSFTRQLKSKGYNIALMSKDGKLHFEKDWPESKIFWSGQQENLVISDNQADIYANADAYNKKILRSQAWGSRLASIRNML